MIYFDRDILKFYIISTSFARAHIHVYTQTSSTVLIIYVHRLRDCYGFNYCYYVVINYHSVGSRRVRECICREADGRFTSQ